MMPDNKTLGRFILDGIPPAPRGVPQIEVTFDIDANGILNVSAKDKASGKSQSIKIEASTSLNKDEVERLKQEAAQHAAEDEKKRALIEERNRAESTVYVAEKSLKENAEKIPAEVKADVEEKIKKVNEAKEKEDIQAISAANQELSSAMQKIGESLYNKDTPKTDDQKGEGQEESHDASTDNN